VFYSRFLSKSRPFIMNDGCSDWLSIKTWNE